MSKGFSMRFFLAPPSSSFLFGSLVYKRRAIEFYLIKVHKILPIWQIRAMTTPFIGYATASIVSFFSLLFRRSVWQWSNYMEREKKRNKRKWRGRTSEKKKCMIPINAALGATTKFFAPLLFCRHWRSPSYGAQLFFFDIHTQKCKE